MPSCMSPRLIGRLRRPSVTELEESRLHRRGVPGSAGADCRGIGGPGDVRWWNCPALQKVSQVELQVADFGQIIDTLVLDAEVVRVRSVHGDKFRVCISV